MNEDTSCVFLMPALYDLTELFDQFENQVGGFNRRTSEPGDKTFGVAIFEAPDEDAARKFLQDDPAVVGGLMTVELHPFAVAASTQESVERLVSDLGDYWC